MSTPIYKTISSEHFGWNKEKHTFNTFITDLPNFKLEKVLRIELPKGGIITFYFKEAHINQENELEYWRYANTEEKEELPNQMQLVIFND